jgi:hypothetical protein
MFTPVLDDINAQLPRFSQEFAFVPGKWKSQSEVKNSFYSCASYIIHTAASHTMCTLTPPFPGPYAESCNGIATVVRPCPGQGPK